VLRTAFTSVAYKMLCSPTS